MNNAILLKKNVSMREEGFSADGENSISPGMLLEVTNVALNSGHVSYLVNGNSSIDARGAIIALENELAGEDLGDTYADGDLIQAEVLMPGDKVQVMLGAAQAVVIGTRLHPINLGVVAANTSGSFVALEALTIATGGTPALINAMYVG